MNFITEQGATIKHINQIIAEDLQHKLRQQLLRSGKINREIERDFEGSNNSANFVIDGKSYPNVTYAFGCTDFENIEAAGEMLIKHFINTLPEKCHVSFRQPIDIEYENGAYNVTMRCATVV